MMKYQETNMFIAVVIGFVAFFILLLVFVAMMDMEELGFIISAVGAVFVGMAWYVDGPVPDIITTDVNTSQLIKESEARVAEAAKAVLEENTLLKGQITLLKGQVLECEANQRTEPDPYGTGY